MVGDGLWYETCLAIGCLVQILVPFLKVIGTCRLSLKVFCVLELLEQRDLGVGITDARDLGVGILVYSKVHTLGCDVWWVVGGWFFIPWSFFLLE